MANCIHYPVRCRTREVCVITGRFQPNDALTPVAASNVGKGFSVSYVSAGKWRVTFEDKYPELDHVDFNRWGATLSAGYSFQVTTSGIDANGKSYFEFVHLLNTAGTFAVANITLASASHISFVAWFRNAGG